MTQHTFLAAGAALLLLATVAAQTPRARDVKLVGDRFKGLTYDEMTPDQKTMIEHLFSGERGGAGGPFNALLRSLKMGDVAQQLGAQVRFHSSLPAKLNELAIIMTARHWTAQYEWYAHRRLALQAGVSAATADAVAAGQRPSSMSPEEEVVYNFGTELLNTKGVRDATFQAVVSKFGERGVVDLVGVMGYYHLVSMLLNVDRYPLPAGVKPELQPLR